jgi:hypothetical protein
MHSLSFSREQFFHEGGKDSSLKSCLGNQEMTSETEEEEEVTDTHYYIVLSMRREVTFFNEKIVISRRNSGFD